MGEPDPEESGRCFSRCWGHPYVNLVGDNAEAFYYYNLCSNQLIMGGMNGSVVGISQAAFFQILELHGVHKLRQLALFYRFKILEREMVKHAQAKEQAALASTKSTAQYAKSGSRRLPTPKR